jgi:hypothetical protein
MVPYESLALAAEGGNREDRISTALGEGNEARLTLLKLSGTGINLRPASQEVDVRDLHLVEL